MTETRKVASTLGMVWSLEKQEYVPELGSGDLLLNVERIHPRLFEEGVLVLVDKAKAPASSSTKDAKSKAESKEE